MRHNISQFEKKLQDEKEILLDELSTVGRINPENKDDWEPIADTSGSDMVEETERAAELTDFRDRVATELTLEGRLNKVNRALERIAEGIYGTCTVCGSETEEPRLNADPAAETCIAHKEVPSTVRPLL